MGLTLISSLLGTTFLPSFGTKGALVGETLSLAAVLRGGFSTMVDG